MSLVHRHDPRDPEAEPCCPECCDCALVAADEIVEIIDAHLLVCAACRGADEPCEVGMALFAAEADD